MRIEAVSLLFSKLKMRGVVQPPEDQMKELVGTMFLARNTQEAPAATADTPLQRAVSPLAQSTYRREYASWPHDTERPFRRRLRGFATNLPDYSGLSIFFATFWLTFAYGIFRWIKRSETVNEPPPKGKG